MIGQIHPKNVYLARGATDLRKSIDGLAAIVQEGFELDPFSSSLFVFCNKYRDKIKILYWDHNGFWLYYRRLEKGRFPWPRADSNEPMIISERQLRWLLDGLPLDQKGAHRKMDPEKVV